MEGAKEGWTKFGKGSPVGNLKDTVMRQKRFGIGNSFSMKGLDGGPDP